jgi:hypothetical protein
MQTHALPRRSPLFLQLSGVLGIVCPRTVEVGRNDNELCDVPGGVLPRRCGAPVGHAAGSSQTIARSASWATCWSVSSGGSASRVATSLSAGRIATPPRYCSPQGMVLPWMTTSARGRSRRQRGRSRAARPEAVCSVEQPRQVRDRGDQPPPRRAVVQAAPWRTALLGLIRVERRAGRRWPSVMWAAAMRSVVRCRG